MPDFHPRYVLAIRSKRDPHAELLAAASTKAPVLDRIHDEVSALTHAKLDLICCKLATLLSKAIMLEVQAIAETFGDKFRVEVERRIEGAR